MDTLHSSYKTVLDMTLPEFFNWSGGVLMSYPRIIGYQGELKRFKETPKRFLKRHNPLESPRKWVQNIGHGVDFIHEDNFKQVIGEEHKEWAEPLTISLFKKEVLPRFKSETKHLDLKVVTLPETKNVNGKVIEYGYTFDIYIMTGKQLDSYLLYTEHTQHSHLKCSGRKCSRECREVCIRTESYNCSISIRSVSSVLTPCISVPTDINYRIILTFTFENCGTVCGQHRRFEVDGND